MSWVRSDDNEPNHPKIFRAGPAAYGYFQAAKCYCSRYLTDGFIPVGDLSIVLPGVTFRQAMALVIRLVDCGLFDKKDDGWLVHDYLDYNPSREQVLERRDERAAAGRLGGLAKAKAGAKQQVRRSYPTGSAPARPGPTQEEEKKDRGAEDASSPPPAFQIPMSIEFALNKCPTLGHHVRAPQFWQAQLRSKPGVNFAAQLLEAESWVVANPTRAPRKSVPAFLNRWFRRAFEDLKA
jgi:hypothetical protein